MPSYAGFYVTPQDWADWAHPRCSRRLAWGSADAEKLIQEALREKKLGDFFAVAMVPVPPSEPRSSDDGLMVYRRWSEKREYLSQRADSKLDFNGPQVLERAIGLKASEWKTIWFNDESSRAPYEAKFLKPRVRKDKDDSEGNGNGKQKKKTKSKNGADDDRKIKFEFKFEDEGACVEDEKDTDHKNQP